VNKIVSSYRNRFMAFCLDYVFLNSNVAADELGPQR